MSIIFATHEFIEDGSKMVPSGPKRRYENRHLRVVAAQCYPCTLAIRHASLCSILYCTTGYCQVEEGGREEAQNEARTHPRWTLPEKDYHKYTYQPSIPDKHFNIGHWNYVTTLIARMSADFSIYNIYIYIYTYYICGTALRVVLSQPQNVLFAGTALFNTSS